MILAWEDARGWGALAQLNKQLQPAVRDRAPGHIRTARRLTPGGADLALSPKCQIAPSLPTGPYLAAPRAPYLVGHSPLPPDGLERISD
jgi:hypothetical protein